MYFFSCGRIKIKLGLLIGSEWGIDATYFDRRNAIDFPP